MADAAILEKGVCAGQGCGRAQSQSMMWESASGGHDLLITSFILHLFNHSTNINKAPTVCQALGRQ